MATEWVLVGGLIGGVFVGEDDGMGEKKKLNDGRWSNVKEEGVVEQVENVRIGGKEEGQE